MKLPIYPNNFNISLSMLGVLTGLTVLTGCAGLSAPDPLLKYQCDGGSHFEVQLRSKYVSYMRGARNSFPRIDRRTAGAHLTFDDGTVLDLSAEKVASGLKLSDGHHTLWSEGNVASWSVGSLPIEQCHLQR